jgi:hypothetical protein
MSTDNAAGRPDLPVASPSGPVRALPGRWIRRGLDALVVMHVVSLGILVLLLAFAGTEALGGDVARVAPLTGSAVVVLFMLACFYARWLFPGLRWRFILAIVLLKELGVLAFFGLVLGALMLVRWLT